MGDVASGLRHHGEPGLYAARGWQGPDGATLGSWERSDAGTREGGSYGSSERDGFLAGGCWRKKVTVARCALGHERKVVEAFEAPPLCQGRCEARIPRMRPRGRNLRCFGQQRFLERVAVVDDAL